MTVADLLKRPNNNADLLRLIAAIAVIWGHAYALQPAPGDAEPIGTWLGFDYSGSLAVKFFFFLSGMLVTNSILKNSSPIKFAINRSFRIYPALMASGAVSLLVIGPILTTLPLKEYFSNSWIYFHIFWHSTDGGYSIPGAFQKNAYVAANGAVWTIGYEIMMYWLLLGLAMVGLFRDKRVATVFLGAAVVAFFWHPEFITSLGLPAINNAGMFVSMFAIGSLLALHKDRIEVNFCVVAGLTVLAYALYRTPLFQWAFYADFVFGSLWLMSSAFVRSLRLPGDFSYGVYVYGWTIQQVVASEFPHRGPHFSQAMSIPVALAVGAISWFAIEKPFLRLGHALPDLIKRLWIVPKWAPTENEVSAD